MNDRVAWVKQAETSPSLSSSSSTWELPEFLDRKSDNKRTRRRKRPALCYSDLCPQPSLVTITSFKLLLWASWLSGPHLHAHGWRSCPSTTTGTTFMTLARIGTSPRILCDSVSSSSSWCCSPSLRCPLLASFSTSSVDGDASDHDDLDSGLGRRAWIRQQWQHTCVTMISTIIWSSATTASWAVDTPHPPSSATRIQRIIPTNNKPEENNVRLAYQWTPPPSLVDKLSNRNNGLGTFVPTPKPVATHLDEMNWTFRPAEKNDLPKEGLNDDRIAAWTRVQIGVTVDPVRIQSLEQFGTPEQVAAKVVLAELQRDGVDQVTLMRDPRSVALGFSTTTAAEDPTNPLGDPKDDSNVEKWTYYDLNFRTEGRRGNKRTWTRLTIGQQKLFVLTVTGPESDEPRLGAEIQDLIDSFTVVRIRN